MLINIALHMLQYADAVDSQIKEKYYFILKNIMNRNEFHIDQIGFDNSFSYLIDDQAKNAQLAKKPLLRGEIKDFN